ISIFPCSFAGGGAAVFPVLGQASFRTTPVEFDKYSKALYPPSYQWLSGMPGVFLGTPLLAPPAFGIRQSYNPGWKMLVMTARIGPKGTIDCRGLTGCLGPGPVGTKDCGGLTCGLGPGPAKLIVDKPGDHALRILPYGYGPVYIVDALAATAGLVGAWPNGGMWPRKHMALVGTWPNGHVALGARGSVVGRSHLFLGAHGRNRWYIGVHGQEKRYISIFPGSFAGGGAAVFPVLGQASFRTTPVKFDKYSKALYPPSYQELLFWLLQLLEFVKVIIPAGRCW
ncbi:hypothetical protein HID58_067250, partial [Brassica napus]